MNLQRKQITKQKYDLEERTAILNEAESKKDFIHKIGICKKEIKETKHWLRLLVRTNPETKENTKIIYREAHELLLFFSKIRSSSLKK